MRGLGRERELRDWGEKRSEGTGERKVVRGLGREWEGRD